MSAGRPVEQLVARALARGALVGDGFPKTITVDGRRRWTIRVQCDIFRALYHGNDGGAFYPDLTPAITTAVSSWRAVRNQPGKPPSLDVAR